MQALAGSIEAQQMLYYQESNPISIKHKHKSPLTKRSETKGKEQLSEQSAKRVVDKSPKHKPSCKEGLITVSPDKDINKNEIKSETMSSPSSNVMPEREQDAYISTEVPTKMKDIADALSSPADSMPTTSVEKDNLKSLKVSEGESAVLQGRAISPLSEELQVSTVSLEPSESTSIHQVPDSNSDSDRDTPRRFSIDHPDSDLDRVDGISRHPDHKSPTSRARSRSRSRSKSPKPKERKSRQLTKEGGKKIAGVMAQEVCMK